MNLSCQLSSLRYALDEIQVVDVKLGFSIEGSCVMNRSFKKNPIGEVTGSSTAVAAEVSPGFTQHPPTGFILTTGK